MKRRWFVLVPMEIQEVDLANGRATLKWPDFELILNGKRYRSMKAALAALADLEKGGGK